MIRQRLQKEAIYSSQVSKFSKAEILSRTQILLKRSRRDILFACTLLLASKTLFIALLVAALTFVPMSCAIKYDGTDDPQEISFPQGIPASIAISDVLSVGSSLFNIDAVDSNGLAVRYELIGGNLSDIVSIDATTGEVTISQEIDRSVAYLYTANLCVFSGTYFCSNARNAQKRQIEITFSPISVVSLVSFTPPVIFISDDVVANTLVLDVDATDSSAVPIGYQITGSTFFEIDTTTGEITTTAVLGVDAGTIYTLRLYVYSNADSCADAPNAVNRNFTVTIIANEITTTNLVNSRTALGSSTVGTSIYTFNSTDVIGSDVSYALTDGNIDAVFTLDATTGEITTTVTLTNGDSYTSTLCIFLNSTTCAGAINAVMQQLTITVRVELFAGPTFYVANDLQANKLYPSSIENGGSLLFGTPITFDASTDSSRALAVADFNGDSFMDIIVANHAQSSAIYFGGAGNIFTRRDLASSAMMGTTNLEIADVDGDNDLDLIFIGNNATHRVYLQDSSVDPLVFTLQTDHNVDTSNASNFYTDSDASSSLAVVDMDGDNNLDVIVVNFGETIW